MGGQPHLVTALVLGSVLVHVDEARLQAGTQLTPSAIGWAVSIRKAETTSRPGQLRLIESQRELMVSVSLTNFLGPRATSSEPLENTMSLVGRQEGATMNLTVGAASCTPAGAIHFDAGTRVTCHVVVTKADGTPFTTGRFLLTVDLTTFVEGLTAEGGTRFRLDKRQDTREVIIAPAATREDRITYLDAEASDRLVARRPADAIPFLEELVMLAPDSAPVNSTLGLAYVQAGRMRDAIAPLERAMGTREGRGNQGVVGLLVSIYMALGAEADAARTLRAHGLSEEDVTRRMQALRERHRRPGGVMQ